MKVKEAIEVLSKFPSDAELLIDDELGPTELSDLVLREMHVYESTVNGKSYNYWSYPVPPQYQRNLVKSEEVVMIQNWKGE